MRVSIRRRTMSKKRVHFEILFEDIDGHWYAEAFAEGRRIGKAWATLEGTRLHLAELKVENEHLILWTGLLKFLRWLDVRPRKINFRSCGVGSALFERLIAQSTRVGVTEIWGSVMPNDISITPYLLSFYESRGFVILPPNDECITGAAHKIVRHQNS